MLRSLVLTRIPAFDRLKDAKVNSLVSLLLFTLILHLLHGTYVIASPDALVSALPAYLRVSGNTLSLNVVYLFWLFICGLKLFCAGYFDSEYQHCQKIPCSPVSGYRVR